MFGSSYLTIAALPHMPAGGGIINIASVTASRGSRELVDYAATEGAIVAFTRSLAVQLAPLGIRVDAVAPVPVWTPLIPSTFSGEKLERFGQVVPLARAGQPDLSRRPTCSSRAGTPHT